MSKLSELAERWPHAAVMIGAGSNYLREHKRDATTGMLAYDEACHKCELSAALEQPRDDEALSHELALVRCRALHPVPAGLRVHSEPERACYPCRDWTRENLMPVIRLHVRSVP